MLPLNAFQRHPHYSIWERVAHSCGMPQAPAILLHQPGTPWVTLHSPALHMQVQ